MPRQTALDAFLETCLEIDTLTAILQAAREDHFDCHPDSVNWTTVETLRRLREGLKTALAEIAAPPVTKSILGRFEMERAEALRRLKPGFDAYVD